MVNTHHGNSLMYTLYGALLSMFIMVLTSIPTSMYAQNMENTRLLQLPSDMNVLYFDDCGVPDRQPHVTPMNGWRIAAPEGEWQQAASTCTFDPPSIEVNYTALPDAKYVLAMLFITESTNERVVSVTSGGRQLIDSYQIKTTPEWVYMDVPSELVVNGRLSAQVNKISGPNAVLSAVALYSNLASKASYHIELTPTTVGGVTGQLCDMFWRGVANTSVEVSHEDGSGVVTTKTDQNGRFAFNDVSQNVADKSAYRVSSTIDGQIVQAGIYGKSMWYHPPMLHPLAVESRRYKLDGNWDAAVDNAEHKRFRTPGQFLQQGIIADSKEGYTISRPVNVPRDWRLGRVIWRLDAVHGSVDYFVNDKKVGHSENLFTPVEVDITDTIRPGRNDVLKMRIYPSSVSEALSHSSTYAHHDLVGVDRSMSLYTLPKQHLTELRVTGGTSNEYKDGHLTLHARLAEPANSEMIHVRLMRDGKILMERKALIDKGQSLLDWSCDVPKSALWSAEKPNLYDLELELRTKKNIIQSFKQKLGFRSIEVKGTQLMVNGVSVKLAGACRHETDLKTGRADTVKWAEMDAKLFKDANVNFIRTSHYPPTREFLDACDRVGLYVEVEAPFCWTRTQAGKEDDASVRDAFLNPTALMLAEHGNHASVIMWSLANESGGVSGGPNQLGLNYVESHRYLRTNDPSRPTVFNNEWALDGGIPEIAIVHYPGLPMETNPDIAKQTRPVMVDEYWHLPCYEKGDLALDPGLRDQWADGQDGVDGQWSQIRASSKLIGGAIWGGIDDIFQMPDGKITGYGEWGIIDSLRRKKPEYWGLQRVYSPVIIPIKQVGFIEGLQSLQIPVENHYSFTDLSDLRFAVLCGSWRKGFTVSLAPGLKGSIALPMPESYKNGDLLTVRISTVDGRLVTHHGIRIGSVPMPELLVPQSGAPKWSQDGKVTVISGEGWQLRLDTQSGVLKGAGLRALPGIHMTQRDEQGAPWSIGGRAWDMLPDIVTRKISDVKLVPHDDHLEISYHDRYEGFEGDVVLNLDRSGVMRVEAQMVHQPTQIAVREFGIRFPVDEALRTISWERKSEWEVYPEGHIGSAKGSVTDTPAEYQAKRWEMAGNDYGSNGFRASRWGILNAALKSADGHGLLVVAQGDVGVRCHKEVGGRMFHVLSASPWIITNGQTVKCTATVQLVPADR